MSMADHPSLPTPPRAATEPHVMATRHTRRLARRYAVLLVLGTGLCLLLLAGLGLGELRSQRTAQLHDMAQGLRERRMALDGVVRPLRDHVARLRVMAEDRLAGREPQRPSPWRPHLRPIAPARLGGLEDAVSFDGLDDAPLGNIMATSSLLARAADDATEIDMALDLLEPMRIAHRNTPYLPWSYYFSARADLIVMFPSLPLAELAAATPGHAGMGEIIRRWLGYEVFALGRPERNLEARPYWTQPYEDSGGTGWMVSHAAPVRGRDGGFAGIVGADLPLPFLGTFLGEMGQPAAGRLWLADDAGRVMAEPGRGLGPPPRLQELVGPGGDGPPSLALLLEPGQGFRGLASLSGAWVAAERLAGTPFTLVHLVPRPELDGLILGRFLPLGLTIGALIVLLLAALAALQRGFMGPALVLAQAIQREGQGQGAQDLPRVPGMWRPLLETVRRAFAERRAYEQRLAASEARFKAAAEGLVDGLAIFDAEDRLVYCNGRYPEHLAAPLRATLAPGKRWSDWLHEAARQGAIYDAAAMGEDYLERRLEDRALPACEREHCLADGRWVSVRESRMADGGRVLLTADISALKRHERELALLATAVAQVGDSVEIAGPDYRLIYVNPAFTRLTGWTAPEAIGRTPAELLRSDRHDAAFYAGIEAAIESGRTWHGQIVSRHKAGHLLYQEATISPLRDGEGRLTHSVAVKRDVGDQRRAEAALRESEARLAALLEHAPLIIHLKDREGRYLLANPECGKLFGCEPAYVIGKTPFDLLPHQTAAEADRVHREVVATGRTLAYEEHDPLVAAYTSTHTIRFPILDKEGKVAVVGCIALDISERRRAEEALRASEQRLRAIVEVHPAPMTITRLEDRRLLFANRAFLATFHLAAEALPRLDHDRLFAAPVERDAVLARLVRDGIVEGQELEMRRAGEDGTFPVAMTARLLDHEGSPCAVASFLDLSPLKAAEAEIARQREALYQSEKLTALGSLLAGVAHELNNPLSVVSGYAEMLRDLAPDQVTRERAQRLHAAAGRCTRIVKTFLAMARQKPPQHGEVRLRPVIEGALELAAYGLRSNGIEVAVEAAADLPPIVGDADQLHQVLVNLVINAQQALATAPPPRRLWIRAGRREGAGLPPTLLVEVSDNGPGIPAELRKRIFEPFFTTKPQGVGTGVGLSVCHGIVAAHGGTIAVDSAPGRGTRFRIVLPVAEAAAGMPVLPAAIGHDEEEEAAGPGRRVLVVDDEPEVADLVAAALRGEGLAVETATSGREALARLRAGGIDLVVSDLRMPDLDGAELIERVQQGEAGQRLAGRLILITGDALGAGGNEAVRLAGLPVLEKPLDLTTLRREVRRQLRDEH